MFPVFNLPTLRKRAFRNWRASRELAPERKEIHERLSLAKETLKGKRKAGIPERELFDFRERVAKSKNILKQGIVFLASFHETFHRHFPEKAAAGKEAEIAKTAQGVVKGTHGKRFFLKVSETYGSSPVAISLNVRSKAIKFKELADFKLGFEKDAVVIEDIQGKPTLKGQPNVKALLDSFGFSQKMHWADFIAGMVEEHASKTGFKKVKIIIPEMHHSFLYPLASTPEQVQRIRQSMRLLYRKLAESRGYRQEGFYLVKDLAG